MTSHGSYKSRVDGVKSLEDASAPRFPVFAETDLTSERDELQRRDFEGRASLPTLYLPTSSTTCAGASFDPPIPGGNGFLIGSAYFRRQNGSTDHTRDFPTPENPHPKIIKHSHYQPEVAQKRHQSSKVEVEKCASPGLPNRQLRNHALQSVNDDAIGFSGKNYGLDMASNFASDARGAR